MLYVLGTNLICYINLDGWDSEVYLMRDMGSIGNAIGIFLFNFIAK